MDEISIFFTYLPHFIKIFSRIRLLMAWYWYRVPIGFNPGIFRSTRKNLNILQDCLIRSLQDELTLSNLILSWTGRKLKIWIKQSSSNLWISESWILESSAVESVRDFFDGMKLFSACWRDTEKCLFYKFKSLRYIFYGWWIKCDSM